MGRKGTAARGGAGSNRELAAALGVDEKSVRNYLGRDDWPVRRKGPWSAAEVQKVRAWREALQEDRAQEGAARGKRDELASKVNVGLKHERLLLTRAQRKRLEGSFVERALLDRALEGLAREFVAALDELEKALPLQLAGLDPGQCEKIVRDRVRSIRSRLASRQVIELEQVEQQIRLQGQPKARGRPGAKR